VSHVVDPRPAAEYPATEVVRLSRNYARAALVVIVFGGLAAVTAFHGGPVVMAIFIGLGVIWAGVLLVRSPHRLQAAVLGKYPWTEWQATVGHRVKSGYRSTTTRFVVVTLHEDNGASYRHSGLYPQGAIEGERVTVWFAGDPATGGVVSFEQGGCTTRVWRSRTETVRQRKPAADAA
jgi:hypothetical protein